MDRLKDNNKLIRTLNVAFEKLQSELKDPHNTINDDLRSLENFRSGLLARLASAIDTLRVARTATINGEENNNSNLSPVIVRRRASAPLDLSMRDEEGTEQCSFENDDWRDTLRRSMAEPSKVKKEEPSKSASMWEQQESDVDDVFEEFSAKSYQAPESPVNGECNGDNADSNDTVIYDYNENVSTEMNVQSKSSSRSSFIFNSTKDLLDVLDSDNEDVDKCAKVVENTNDKIGPGDPTEKEPSLQGKSDQLSDSQLSSISELSESLAERDDKVNNSEKLDSSQCSKLSVVLVDCVKYSQSSQSISSRGTEGTADVSFLKSMDELLKVCRVEYIQPELEMQPNLRHMDVADNLLKYLNDVEEKKAEEEKLKEEIQNWTYTSSDESQSSDDKDSDKGHISLNKLIEESSYSSTDVDDIDRLCDLSTLKKRKKHPKTSRGKKIRMIDSSSSDTSDSSESGSDIELIPSRPATPKLDAATVDKINEMVMSNINDDDEAGVSSSSDDDDKEEEEKGKKMKKCVEVDKSIKVDDDGDDDESVKKVSAEEQAKKSWRNDPLLTTRISSDESDDCIIGPKKMRNKRRISSSESSSHGENSRKTINKFFSIDVSSDSSSCDSDCEIVGRDETNVVPNDEESDRQKGRRNIRALVSDECLAEATQRANREEQERIERLEERRRKMSSLSESMSQMLTPSPLETQVEPLILDLDEYGNPLVEVHRKLVKGLKPHQIEGVKFLWDSCYESLDMVRKSEGSGCILAHCMGLGKTAQVITLIQAVFSHKGTNTKHVLVVCPLSTVPNWQKEIDRVFEPVLREKFHTFAVSNASRDPYETIKNWSVSKRSVLIVGYDLFRTITNDRYKERKGENRFNVVFKALIDPGPDLIVCDEGHLLMNKDCHRTRALCRVKTKRRIVLTGTPLQNNLKEYYHMVQFVKPNLLGTFKEYKTNFVNPITNGQYKDSTVDDISLMKKRTHVLHNLLKKTIHRVEDTELKTYLPKIVDYAVFIKMTEFQTELHKRFMDLIVARREQNKIITNYLTFQYIGSHPSVLIRNDRNNRHGKKTKEQDVITDHDHDRGEQGPRSDGWYKTIMPADVEENIEYGNKLLVLRGIIEESEKIGDKVLVFSQSLAEMDVIEQFLSKVGTTNCPSWKKEVDYLRMDGTVLPELRIQICDKFNDKSERKIRLLLMSIKVGGLGLNLTAANRVVIMTVSWNPSYDVQSVFRVYRFGQEKEVFVYRLVSVGTMEEKVYQRTVTKLAVARRVVDKHQIQRHYKTLDLEDMYSCKPELITDRPRCRLPEDAILATLILKLTCLYKYHDHQTLLANRPEENLNPSEQAAAWEEFKNNQFAPPPPPVPQLPQPGPHAYPQFAPSGPSASAADASRAPKYKRRNKYSYDAVNLLHRRPQAPSLRYDPNSGPGATGFDTAAGIAAIRNRMQNVFNWARMPVDE